MTTVLGVIPLALAAGVQGKEILQPVAVVLLGGLITSTTLDQVVTPAIFYRYGHHIAAKILGRDSAELRREIQPEPVKVLDGHGRREPLPEAGD